MKFLDFITPKNSFQKGIWWNFLTFITLGISGIFLNVLILIFYGTEILGVFNQVYAIYILAGQLAVFGLYASVLKYTSQYSEKNEICNKIFTSALILGIFITTFVTFFYYLFAPLIGKILNSHNVSIGLVTTVVGLWCFSLNKVLLSFVNGLSQMKAYALFMTFRYAMLPVSLMIFIFLDLPGYFTPFVFTVTEFLLLIGLFFYVFRFFSFVPIGQCKNWVKRHLSFGVKSLVGGSVVEINTRVDVLMLGLFLSDKIVGIYSFSAMLAEGFDQIPAIFKVNYNPLLAKFAVQKRFAELRVMIKSFLKKWMLPSFAVGVLAISMFPIIVKIIPSDIDISSGWVIFAILMAGITLRSGHMVFWELPSQSGHPGYQTILVSMVAVSNVVLNYFFILQWGIYGAAIATALSFVLGVVYLKIIVKKLLRVRI